MHTDERRVTVIALLGGLLLALFLCFSNFFLLYTLKLFRGGVPAGRYMLITLGVVLTGSPFYWLYRQYRMGIKSTPQPETYTSAQSAPTYTAREKELVLELRHRQGGVTLEDIVTLTGLNPAQAQALLLELEPTLLSDKSDRNPTKETRPTEKDASAPLENALGENPFDIDFPDES